VPLPVPPPAPETLLFAQDGCTGYLLGLFIDPRNTDPYLPPGFHLRDPKDFLPPSPNDATLGSGTGLALVLLVSLICAPTPSVPAYREAASMIFINPPTVDGQRPNATFDFYEVEHYSDDPAVRARLGAWQWPVVNATLTDKSLPQVHAQEFAVQAGAPDGIPYVPSPEQIQGEPLFYYAGATPGDAEARLGFAGSVLRTWRQFPDGIARMDYSLDLNLNVGSGSCVLRQGSRLANLTGGGLCATSLSRDSLAGVQAAIASGQAVTTASFKTGFHAVAVRQLGVKAR
jgi:hypothetical protein